MFLLNVNIDTNDNLYQHLVEIKKLSPPPLQSSISRQAHKTKASLGRSTNGSSKDKGMKTLVYKNEAQIHYSSFAPTSSPPSMLPNSSIYSPSMRSEGSIWSVYRYMEGQESSYLLLEEGKLQIFLFWAHFLMYAGHSGARCVYMRFVSC